MQTHQHNYPRHQRLRGLTLNPQSQKKNINPLKTLVQKKTDETTASESTSSLASPLPTTTKSRKVKKIKTIVPNKTVPVPIENMLEPLKEILNAHGDKYILNYENLKEFIKSTKGIPRNKILETSLRFTPETKLLHMMLYDLYNELTAKTIKQRFTIIMRYLDNDQSALSDEITEQLSSNNFSNDEPDSEDTEEE